MKQLCVLFSMLLFISCNKKIVVERTAYFPKQTELITDAMDKQNVWVFILAGQSNMAGRGMVEPQDTISNKRILSINKNGQLIIAKEPLHFYEPNLAGLDCGYSFGKAMIKNIPDSISILLLPTAVGGSSISQWLGDSLFRNVKLFSNFLAKVEIGKQHGIIKGILWHQGESDTNEKNIPLYPERLSKLFTKFRLAIGNDNLPILLGELGSFSKNTEGFELINKAIHNYSARDANTAVITTADLKHKGDSLHFNAKAQRTMGKRFAAAYVNKFLQ
jgi:Carbohydrate esterase, sialic acid-specific acetylesterase